MLNRLPETEFLLFPNFCPDLVQNLVFWVWIFFSLNRPLVGICFNPVISKVMVHFNMLWRHVIVSNTNRSFCHHTRSWVLEIENLTHTRIFFKHKSLDTICHRSKLSFCTISCNTGLYFTPPCHKIPSNKSVVTRSGNKTFPNLASVNASIITLPCLANGNLYQVMAWEIYEP